jgi:hypothetical protein
MVLVNLRHLGYHFGRVSLVVVSTPGRAIPDATTLVAAFISPLQANLLGDGAFLLHVEYPFFRFRNATGPMRLAVMAISEERYGHGSGTYKSAVSQFSLQYCVCLHISHSV